MTNYTESILQLRTERDQQVTAKPLNWLALCGRFYLEEGENSIGSDPSCNIVLPGFPAPRTGILRVADGHVTLAGSVDGVTVNEKAPEANPLRTDVDGDQDTIAAGQVRMQIIVRGGRFILRAWDLDSQAVKDFHGLHYYPVNPEYCIKAVYHRYDPPMKRTIYNVIGNELEAIYPGWVEFSIDGVNCRLEAEDIGDELLLNFTDLSKADKTYPGGRNLEFPYPDGDEVTLDFNLAANWPCAYTSFATCPLPPFENRLPVRIDAGEQRYHD
jgi:uncharacterized protein (DUF1684 family)